MGGEIVTFWVGQCGVQLGSSCWELYSLEHSISPQGQFFEESVSENNTHYTFFMESEAGQYVPRSIMIDLEPLVIDEIRMGAFRNLFNPATLVNGYEDAASNFARGFYSGGRHIIRDVVQITRRLIEQCDNIEGFMIHHSYGGGTGSGFTSMLLEYLTIEYAKIAKLEFGVFPSESFSSAVVEPYNTVLAMHTPMENADLAAFFDNQSIYNIFNKNLDIENITYSTMNRLVAQVLSGATASLRFLGPLHANIIDCQTNLIPYPRIHFPVISYGPVQPPSKINHDICSTRDITETAFLNENQLATVKPLDGAYMSCCLFYRGEINVSDVNTTITRVKSNWKMPWVDWCPTGFKIGINLQPMLPIPGSGLGYSSRSVTMLCNTTAIRSIISNMNEKFMMLFEKKAFLHWYISEGMEEHEFIEGYEDVLVLEKDYEVIEHTCGLGDLVSDTIPVNTVYPSTLSDSAESNDQPESTEESDDDDDENNESTESSNKSRNYHNILDPPLKKLQIPLQNFLNFTKSRKHYHETKTKLYHSTSTLESDNNLIQPSNISNTSNIITSSVTFKTTTKQPSNQVIVEEAVDKPKEVLEYDLYSIYSTKINEDLIEFPPTLNLKSINNNNHYKQNENMLPVNNNNCHIKQNHIDSKNESKLIYCDNYINNDTIISVEICL